MLQCLGVTRKFDMDDKGDGREVDTARGDIRRHTDAGSLVAQRLKRIVALRLAMLARQRHCLEAALRSGWHEGAGLLPGSRRTGSPFPLREGGER
jgi:hypothetical protein